MKDYAHACLILCNNILSFASGLRPTIFWVP